MNIESKWLEDFLMLAEVRNFSMAADKRNVTQPAFSRRIKALEQTVGAELVDRSKTPIALTPSGRLFRITARTLINQMMDGIGQLSDLSKLGGNNVRVAAAHSLATSLVPSIQSELMTGKHKPILSVEAIDVDDAIEELQEGGCDLLLAFDDELLRLPPYQSLQIGQAELLPVCACDGSGKPLFRITNHKEVPWLAYSPSSYMGRQVEAIRNQVNLQPVFLSSMTDLLKTLVLQGLGVAWLPDYAIRQELENGRVAIVGDASLRLPITYYAYRYQARLHPAGEQVWQALRLHAEKQV
ncbi:LysR substrate-binding domain-containing protein [Photobacterium sp. DA100]|uniref:LysR substrate-binding domain-containing protein n=1 Tax=Photobacterium sp. DA100 TaxID=3027472 RepID=UPI002479CBF7|nr:LysR substrate-binding domain-containing protein [Photobacterium sp. DA100]WEM43365.1 LysR substrate-binding domain-containing protein [Photobacterium sp. DA100]